MKDRKRIKELKATLIGRNCEIKRLRKLTSLQFEIISKKRWYRICKWLFNKNKLTR
jgi:hypothetical protein